MNTSVISPNSTVMQTSNKLPTYVKFPNIPDLSNKISRLFKDFEGIKLVLYNTKTTQSLFTKLKDKEELKNKSNLVYQIFCEGCDKNYIGQTSQRVEKRISQHKTTCTDPKHKEKSTLAFHHHDTEHKFDFDNYKIVDMEPNPTKRRISEMIYITLQFDKKINARSDTDNLSASYKHLISLHKKHTGV